MTLQIFGYEVSIKKKPPEQVISIDVSSGSLSKEKINSIIARIWEDGQKASGRW